MVVKLDEGAETEYGRGDLFCMPAGHDAWIVGDKRCVILDFTDVANYAEKELASPNPSAADHE
jgi:hypothetical protein